MGNIIVLNVFKNFEEFHLKYFPKNLLKHNSSIIISKKLIMKNLLLVLLDSSSGWGGFVARMTVGLIMLPHGCQKMLGWFGGRGYSRTIERFTVEEMNYPFIIAFLIIFFEFFGALFVTLGFFSRFMAFGIAVVMIGAIAVAHWEYGYFLNWHGKMEGEGSEFNLLMIGACIVVMVLGSGKYSIDNLLVKLLNQ